MEEKDIALSQRQCNESESYCPICYDKFWSHVVWQCRFCTGEYHFLCILEWLLRKYNCPCCRANERPIFNIMVNQEVFVILPTTPSELTLWLKHMHFLICQSFQATVESSGDSFVGYGIPMAFRCLYTLFKHLLRFVMPHLMPLLVFIFLYISKLLQLLVRVAERHLMLIIWLLNAPFNIWSFISRHLIRIGHSTFDILWKMLDQLLKGEFFFNPRSHLSVPLLRIHLIAERG